MAKADNASVVEQHVEKLLLLVCLVLLGVAVYRWVLSSPVQLSAIRADGVGTRKDVPAEEVDGILRQAAQSVKAMYDRGQVPAEPMPKYASNTLVLRNITPPKRPLIDTSLPGRPLKPVGVADRESVNVRLAELVALMPAPPKPVVSGFLELPKKDERGDVVVARGMLAYPMGELLAAWQKRLGKANVPVEAIAVAAAVVVEVQQQLPSGDWSPAKKVAVAVRPGTDGKPVALPAIPDPNDANVQAVRDTRNALGKTWQDHVLKPQYYPIWLSAAGGWGQWRVHLPKVDVKPGEEAVWFHDDTTPKLGVAYRYRVRLVFVNPILTYKLAAEDPAEALVKFIETKPSEPSDPIRVRRQVRFYLTGANVMTREMTVTVYTQKWGQTVKKDVRVQPGEIIGGKANVTVRDPFDEPGATQTVEVDFATGAVSLRFDFNKVIMGKGIKVRTAEVLYLDKDGRLKSRTKASDDRDPLRIRLEREVKQARGEE